MYTVISLQEHKNKNMIIAMTPRLLLDLVMKSNETGRLQGHLEDVILAQKPNGEWGYKLVNKGFGRS